MAVAVVTGASRGLGHALAAALGARGWRLVIDARGAADLAVSVRSVRGAVAIPGDVADPAHRSELAMAAADLGGADLLVNNASALGPSPLPPLAEIEPDALTALYVTNALAPLALAQVLLPQLREHRGRIVNISSDAAVEAYPGWGAYGSAKAALDQLSAVLAAEEPAVRVYAFDPGDMRTRMHQDAYPGEDISDRAEPVTVVPALLGLVDGDFPSGRYKGAELSTERAGVVA
jgi:NAD(P)-dependent dehydrogenase (short-subunit alcohol dehydrogenase family)